MRGAAIGGAIGFVVLVVMSLAKGEGGSLEYMIPYLAGGTLAGAAVGYLIGRNSA